MAFLGPVITGIGSVLSGAFSFFSGSTILAGALKIGLGLAAQYAIGELFAPDVPAQVSYLQAKYGQDLPRHVVLGTRGLPGHHLYRNAFGKGGRTVQDVYVLSHFRISGVTRVRYEGQWRTLGGPVDAERGLRVQGIEPEIWVKVYQGSLGQVADPGLIARANPPTRWTADHRLAGLAYAIVTQQIDREKLPNTWEAFFEVEGLCYDWRQDSSVGGAGLQRWNDPTTWLPSSNPIVQQYNLERGFWLNGTLLVGKGVSTDRLPLGKWTLAANISDEVVGTTKRYASAYIATAGQGITHAANMAPLLAACAGSWYEGPDGEYPIAGASQAIVATITDADLIVDEDDRFSRFRTRSELVNTIAGTYASPDAFYDNAPLATRTDAPAFAADRERLATSIPYEAVTDPKVGDRLNDIALRASRYQGNGEICLRQKFLGLKVGQWIRWQSTWASGFDKTFQIVRRRLGPIGSKACRAVYVTLQEVGEGIFDPTAYQTTPPDATGPGAPDYQSELINFNVSAIKLTAATGSERPGLRATWNALEDVTIVDIRFEYGPVSAVGQVPDKTATVTALRNQTRQDMFEGVMSESLWAIHYIMRSQPARTFFPSPWVYVTTLSAKLNLNDVYTDGLVEEINEQIGKQLAPMNVNIREQFERDRNIARLTSEQDGGQYFDHVQSLTKVSSAYNGVTAEYQLAITAATGPGSALVQRIEFLEATIPNLATVSALNSLTLVVSNLSGTVSAQATSINGLQATVGGFSASNMFRAYVAATEAGALSTIGLSVAASGGGSTSQAAILMSALAGGLSSVSVVADRFAIVSAGYAAQPFVFEAGELKLIAARIGTATVNLFKTPSGKTQFGVFPGGAEGLRVTV